MKEHFVSYEVALAMKSMGFDEPCFTYYYNDGKIRTGLSIHINNGWTYKGTKKKETTLAPLKSQFFKWVREKYGLHSFVFIFDEGFGYETYKEGVTQTNDSFDTYEQAEESCIDKIIELLKNK